MKREEREVKKLKWASGWRKPEKKNVNSSSTCGWDSWLVVLTVIVIEVPSHSLQDSNWCKWWNYTKPLSRLLQPFRHCRLSSELKRNKIELFKVFSSSFSCWSMDSCFELTAAAVEGRKCVVRKLQSGSIMQWWITFSFVLLGHCPELFFVYVSQLSTFGQINQFSSSQPHRFLYLYSHQLTVLPDVKNRLHSLLRILFPFARRSVRLWAWECVFDFHIE